METKVNNKSVTFEKESKGHYAFFKRNSWELAIQMVGSFKSWKNIFFVRTSLSNLQILKIMTLKWNHSSTWTFRWQGNNLAIQRQLSLSFKIGWSRMIYSWYVLAWGLFKCLCYIHRHRQAWLIKSIMTWKSKLLNAAVPLLLKNSIP